MLGERGGKDNVNIVLTSTSLGKTSSHCKVLCYNHNHNIIIQWPLET